MAPATRWLEPSVVRERVRGDDRRRDRLPSQLGAPVRSHASCFGCRAHGPAGLFACVNRQRLRQFVEGVGRQLEQAQVRVAQLQDEERRAADRQGAEARHHGRQRVDRGRQSIAEEQQARPSDDDGQQQVRDRIDEAADHRQLGVDDRAEMVFGRREKF